MATKSDKRYLLQRRRGWYVRIRVPDSLREQLGKNEIVSSLRTRDLAVAQLRRLDKIAEVKNLFASLRGEVVAQDRQAEREAFHREVQQWINTIDDWNQEYPLEEGLLDYLSDQPQDSLGWQAARYFFEKLQGMAPALPKRYQMTISETAKAYLEDARRDPNTKVTEHTLGQSEAVFKLFSGYTSDTVLDDVTKAVAVGFLDTVARLSPTWGKSPGSKALSFQELLDKYGSREGGLSNRTLNRYSSRLKALFTWAQDRSYWTGEANPFDGLHRKEPDHRKVGWLPYEDTEVLAILEYCAKLPPEDALRWVPLIGAYSGMRSNEICSLNVADIQCLEGVWFFDITEAKTEAGIRRVPIHSEIVKGGFLIYLKNLPQDGQAFPSLTPGGRDRKLNWYFSTRFVRLRRKLGITRPRIGFHSFRKSVGTQLERARVPESEAVQALGHEKMSLSYTVYSLGITLKRLQEIIEVIRYERKG